MKGLLYKHFTCYLFVFIEMVLFAGGCGLVAVMGTATNREKRIPAEYKFNNGEKILVLVNQPGWLNAKANLLYHLTQAIYRSFIMKLRIPPQCLISYDELCDFRSNRTDFWKLTPIQVGEALGANKVLVVYIEDCQLYEMGESGYHKGWLSARAVVLDVGSGKRVWPKNANSKDIKVGFEFEREGAEAAVTRLADACAYCVIRYFYDCPKDKFKIAEDISGIGWGDWK